MDALEALSIGLANRLVPAGEVRAAAEELARNLAALLQECPHGDRRSVLAQEGLSEREALRSKFATAMGEGRLGPEAVKGARRFASGEGRHGGFDG